MNTVVLRVVALDFSNGHAPSNGGPTKTSRALAIIHLAARDAYAKVTSAYAPKLPGLPAPPPGVGPDDPEGQAAAIGAGARAATLLYPDFADVIAGALPDLIAGLDPNAVMYGAEIGNIWVASRHDDGSSLPQLDTLFSAEPGRYRPDPVSNRPSLGRAWGRVTPFVISSVEADAPLGPPPALTSRDYAESYDDVFVNGRDNIARRGPEFQEHAAIGVFWAYDGTNLLGTPPRLYNQIVVAAPEFVALAPRDQLNVLAAIHAAMADAAIAAWYWKYKYDLWRPVTAIREANAGFGPTGKGDGNRHRKHPGDPFWLPLGAPNSNPFPGPVAGAPGMNFTPNFPAYPSGHATIGTACFDAFADLLGKRPREIVITRFVSDEFSGMTKDNEGVIRPRWEQTFSLEQAIEQNKISRIYLGVHWSFDATGGADVGKAIALKTVAAFR